MTDLSGKWYIDGFDLYSTFNLFIEKGTADFLQFPPVKQSQEHDWLDANGREIDKSRVFFDQREIVLNIGIIATTKQDFLNKQRTFLAQFGQPGLHRFEVSAHGPVSYYIYYKECNNYQAVKPLQGEETGLFAYRFSIVVIEPEPEINPGDVFIVDEEGRFLIT